MACCDHQDQGESPGGGEAIVIGPGVRSYQRQILCAEGHQDTREFLAIWLGLAGYEVAATETVAECVELALSRRFDLYLIGDGFVDGAGIDLAKMIRSFDGQTPLVFHSAQAYPKDLERGIKAGAQAYVTKPSDPYDLLQTISRLIKTDAGEALPTGDMKDEPRSSVNQ